MKFHTFLFFYTFLFVFSRNVYCQVIWKTEKGQLSFVSEAPLEIIKAQSGTLKGIFASEKQEFAFSLDLKTLAGFNSPLQKEHFHENYMESNKYPTVTFKGKVIEKIDFTKNAKYSVRAKGWLDLHGVKQERIIKGDLEIKDKKLIISASFVVWVAEHNIAIPKIVNQKISEKIDVVLRIEMLQ
jgi:hypothetical protein